MYEVRGIAIEGNDRTRAVVIEREVPFSVGDSISAEDFQTLSAEIVRNLTNTSLFNFVEVEFIQNLSQQVVCLIKVDERWYIWPGIIFSLAETNIHTWWQNKDPERINFGFYLQDFNFRGRREKLQLNFQYGWKRKVGLNYQIPGLNRKRTLGGGLEIYYANNREINHRMAYEPDSVFNTRDFLKARHFIQEEFIVNSKLEYRPRFLSTHRFIAGVHTVSVDDTVVIANPDYLPRGKTRSQYIFLSYGYKLEKRDNRAYPLHGYLIDASLDQTGLGLLRQNDVVLTELLATVNSHHQLADRWYFGHGIKTKTTLYGSPPYYFQRGLGYGNNYVRGYELFVIDGQHYFLYRSNVKYALVKKHIIDFNLPVFKKFDKLHYSAYLNMFGDAGYVADRINAATNPLANQLIYSVGLSLDVVTYYDLVVRFEGSVNKEGKPAFFINFQNPI
ncbi:MAG: hypothetical protein Kow0075_03250 [Salibacteraceae bacterium]